MRKKSQEWKGVPLNQSSVDEMKTNEKFLQAIRHIYNTYGFSGLMGGEMEDSVCNVFYNNQRLYSWGIFSSVRSKAFMHGFFQRVKNQGSLGYRWRLNPEIENYKDELGLETKKS